MVAVTAVEWVADVHSEHTWELADAGLFLEVLCIRFEDGTGAQRAEGEILALTQRAQPAVEYVHEFH